VDRRRDRDRAAYKTGVANRATLIANITSGVQMALSHIRSSS